MPDEPKTLDPAVRPARTSAPAATTTQPGAAATAGDSPAPGPARRLTLGLVTVGLVLAALNLRPAITSLGALLEEVSSDLHMSGTVAGVLTSVPPLCFAVFGITAPRLARRFGPAAVVCAGMAAIFAGLLLRPFAGGTAGFLAASALALMGIAVSNVLMPVIVKRYFPERIGSMTGLYSMALALGTSIAAAATVPMTDALGGDWRVGLGVWAAIAALAVLPWIPLVRDRDRTATTPAGPQAEATATSRAAAGATVRPGAAGATAAAGTGATTAAAPRITRSRTAWALGVFFGLQATGAYITMGWMPQIFRDAGVPASTAGVLLAVTMVMGVPLAFVIPRLATRMKNQGPIVVALGLCGLTGYTGLFLAPSAGAWVWAVLLGISNCSFPLALTMIGMRSRTGAGVVRLSAFAQSVGYLISIPGPLLVGVLYQHSGGWGLPIVLMGSLMIPQMIVGTLAGRDRTVEDEC
ncbi:MULTISPECIES: CynX/NimT family MFS transporter [Streptomyces]|uniref:Putative integral membrane transporter n=1 Tax=Streptomyces venezuelae (strain ATCC 10712 / CBS 650.69 / DSM 40230 / JCM 4526 / NBRC 13096 / PD 04745) TaxID=953739 RepID=F2RFF3_STRVP|nr:MFS transporter [Streptomyces venezuelae]APE20797.1 MFS transporter [Streptomyces venezuelae]QER98189.1 CynX/NimT family MFS transporter [Streptomyces venezuelae ATCC 10712]CCA54733.1 putative integral membrane transporter [Streptomyces venezuelae ATCC 10712]